MEIEYKGKKIEQIEKELDSSIDQSLKYLTTFIWKEAITNAPRVTGTLKRSIQPDYPKKDTGRVRAGIGIKYGIFVEQGTKPHIIKPKQMKALHWITGGAHYFAKIVHHPGTRGQFFMRRAFQSGEKESDGIFSKFISITLKE